ncbi:MAG: nucleoside hydrolase, partial [Erysipelotrichaceae bacterium]|nr:nucleoside hydrolase [Erysipelotrichaceae bacterium]
AEKENAIVAMYNAIKNSDEKVTIIPTGPLTNIALLLNTFEDSKDYIEQILLMGGAAVGGNATPYAEFNIYTDEVAAHTVFNSGIKMVMCGLDVTMHCGVHEDYNNLLVNSDNIIHQSFGLMMKHYIDRRIYKDDTRDGREAYIHDAVPFMYLVHPEIFDGFYATVNVPIGEVERRGQTQTTPCEKDDPNAVLVLNQVQSELFTKYLLDAIYTY